MTQIKTALRGSYGSTVNTSKGEVEFDGNGIAEVSEEMAEFLKTSFPDVYFTPGEEEPTPETREIIDPKDDPNVKAFAASHNAAKTAEQNGAAPQVVMSTAKEREINKGKEGLVDAQGDEIKTEEPKTEEVPGEEVVEETTGTVAEETAEEEKVETTADELDLEIVLMLEKLDVSEIQETLVQAGVQDDETAKITDKDQLIPIAAKRLV